MRLAMRVGTRKKPMDEYSLLTTAQAAKVIACAESKPSRERSTLRRTVQKDAAVELLHRQNQRKLCMNQQSDCCPIVKHIRQSTQLLFIHAQHSHIDLFVSHLGNRNTLCYCRIRYTGTSIEHCALMNRSGGAPELCPYIVRAPTVGPLCPPCSWVCCCDMLGFWTCCCWSTLITSCNVCCDGTFEAASTSSGGV